METFTDLYSLTLAAAVALRGLGAGIITGVELITLPARRRMGVVSYARFARAHYAGGGVSTYAAVTVLGGLLTLALSAAALRLGKPAAQTSCIVISLLATLLGFAGTAGAFPAMRRLRRAPDDEQLLAGLLDRFARWGLFSAAWHVVAFVALVAALAESGR